MYACSLGIETIHIYSTKKFKLIKRCLKALVRENCCHVKPNTYQFLSSLEEHHEISQRQAEGTVVSYGRSDPNRKLLT